MHTKGFEITDSPQDFIHCFIALEKQSTPQSPMSLPVQIEVIYSSGEISGSLNNYTFNIQLTLWQLCTTVPSNSPINIKVHMPLIVACNWLHFQSLKINKYKDHASSRVNIINPLLTWCLVSNQNNFSFVVVWGSDGW